jgi:hypothetical protein
MKRLPEFETRHPLAYYMEHAQQGTKTSVELIMRQLNRNMTLAESKFIDFALGQIESEEGLAVMKNYFFHGTQLQRNYCALFFSRRGDHKLVKEVYDLGLIDDKQAFSR